MTRTPNERQDDTDLRVSVGVIQSQVEDIKKALGRVEVKIDNNSYVHTSQYNEDRKADAAEYATKEEIKPIKNMFYAILTTVMLGLVTAFITFALKGGLQ